MAKSSVKKETELPEVKPAKTPKVAASKPQAEKAKLKKSSKTENVSEVKPVEVYSRFTDFEVWLACN
jgi:hypothetical protein